MTCGDIKIVPPIQMTLMASQGETVPAYRINYQIRGLGNYYIMLPVEGFTADKALAALQAAAQPIIDTLDKLL